MTSERVTELADNHKRIWLAPRCEVDERTWCQDDQGCCDECSEEWVEYVRADIAKAEIERLRAALRELHAVVWGECPSLLNEDSGGDAGLDLRIRELIGPDRRCMNCDTERTNEAT